METKTILIVDDEAHVTHLLAHKVKKEGFDVITADDGEQGYRLACEHKPDLVISDFQMPVLTGYEMSVKLRTNNDTAQIPILMLTARGHKLTEVELNETNIKVLMSKPFSARDLIAKARSLLEEGGAASLESYLENEGRAA